MKVQSIDVLTAVLALLVLAPSRVYAAEVTVEKTAMGECKTTNGCAVSTVRLDDGF
jgi:hypothetical protein